VLTSIIAWGLIGIDLEQIVDVSDERDLEAPVLDIATILHLPVSAEQGDRRVLMVQTGQERQRLLIGTQGRVRPLPREAFIPLPALLEGLTVHAAIRSLFVIDRRIGYLLNAYQLVELGRGQRK
jgi:hypothetical protein